MWNKQCLSAVAINYFGADDAEKKKLRRKLEQIF